MTWTKVEKKIKCGVCGIEIMTTNRRQKFCVKCSSERKKEYNKLYDQKRQQKEINKTFEKAGVML